MNVAAKWRWWFAGKTAGINPVVRVEGVCGGVWLVFAMAGRMPAAPKKEHGWRGIRVACASPAAKSTSRMEQVIA